MIVQFYSGDYYEFFLFLFPFIFCFFLFLGGGVEGILWYSHVPVAEILSQQMQHKLKELKV